MTTGTMFAAGGTETPAGRGGIEILEVVPQLGSPWVTLARRSSVDVGSVGYLAADRRRKLLYAATQADGGAQLSVHRWSDEGELEEVSRESVSAGASHLCLAEDGDHLLTAEYGAGTISLFRLVDDGTRAVKTDEFRFEGSGPHPRQEAPHPHQVLAVGGSYIVPDLGTDLVHRFEVTAGGRLSHRHAWRMPAGFGPRHAIVVGGVLFVNGELSGELRWGRLSDDAELDRAIPASTTGAAEVAPSGIGVRGTSILVANRGPGTILSVTVSPDGVRTRDEFASGGTWPRDFDVVGEHLAIADLRDDRIRLVALDAPHAIVAETALSGPSCIVAL